MRGGRRVAEISRHMVGGESKRSLSQQAESSVKFERTGLVERIKLNRPSKFNALTLEMVRNIKPEYDRVVKNGGQTCVLMTGEGGKAFCAGGDVASIRLDALEGSGSLKHDFFYEEYQLNHRIATGYDKHQILQIALWDGVTMGGGVGLSVHGKIRIATEQALFAMPETALGLFPDVGGTFALSRLRQGKNLGMFLALTGQRLGAADCVYSGLATHFLPRDKIPTFVDQLVQLGDKAANYDAVDSLIAQVGGGAQPPLDGKVKPVLEKNIDNINACFQYESVEEILQALQMHADKPGQTEENKVWAEAQLKTLLGCSPLSLKVTCRAILLHAPQTVTIGQALQNEYRIVQRMCDNDGDFFEGVRAILVDKDNKAKWNHDHVSHVPDSLVDQYFAPLPADHPRGELTF